MPPVLLPVKRLPAQTFKPYSVSGPGRFIISKLKFRGVWMAGCSLIYCDSVVPVDLKKVCAKAKKYVILCENM